MRDATPEDAAAIVELNNAAVPAVNFIDAELLGRIAALASWYRVAEDEEGIVGFVLCIPSGREYWSGNYRWFSERYDSFLYLDRVVVAERTRGRGVGEALYEEMHAYAASGWPRVTLEVNLRPPNPGSDRFHRRLGYEAVGEREYEDGHGAVTLYVRTARTEERGERAEEPRKE